MFLSQHQTKSISLSLQTCFILNHLSGCYPGAMGTSRAVPLLLIFIPPHIHSEHTTVVIPTLPAVSFDTWAGFPYMYMSADYLVSTGLRTTGLNFLTLLVDCLSERAGYFFSSPHWASL